MVWESTVSNTELSELLDTHAVRGRELSEFLSAHDSAGVKHDFRRMILGVYPRGPAKSLRFLCLKDRSVLRQCSLDVLAGAEGIFTLISPPKCTKTSPWGAPRGSVRGSRSKKLCPLGAPHWGTPGDAPHTTQTALPHSVSRQDGFHQILSNPATLRIRHLTKFIRDFLKGP